MTTPRVPSSLRAASGGGVSSLLTPAATKLRKIRIEGDVAFIPLTKGYEAIIDAVDIPLIDGANWHASICRKTIYARRAIYSGSKPKILRLHRVLMGEPNGLFVDHIDGNGLNNRRSNLRIATNAQNQHNRRACRANTSGFKGVSFYKKYNKWQALIKVYGKRIHLGYFENPECAFAAYKEASIKYHGKFARAL